MGVKFNGGYTHPAKTVDWYKSRYGSSGAGTTRHGWALFRGSGMLSSVAVVSDASTTTRDTPGIHVATREMHIVEADGDGTFTEVLSSSGARKAPKSHDAHFKALANAPRSMLALTTCVANNLPSYTCTGAGVDEYYGRSSISVSGGRFDSGAGVSSRPDYLTSKIWARYPRLGMSPGDDPETDPNDQYASPYAGQLLDFKLPRSAFVADCNAATIEVCNKAEEQCQPFLCTQEVKTYKGPVEAFGIAFANYGLATAVLMPLFALLAARIGRKPAGAAGETTVSVSEEI